MDKNKKINITIIGSSGYTGIELIRILLNHPNAVIKQVIANNNSGNYLSEIYPHLKNEKIPQLISLDDANWDNIDIIFLCLPHGTSQKIISKLPNSIKIIDLAADFRIKDTKEYFEWYREEHQAANLLSKATYGLPEIFEDEIKKAPIIACPGCFPTSSILPLFPILQKNLISSDNIIIDSKSGISGAGRNPKQNLLFCEINTNAYAYNVCKHRHIAEIEQTLSIASNSKIKINFIPQLIPVNRGILSTIYVSLNNNQNIEDLHKTLQNFYKNSYFVKIMDIGYTPSIAEVQNTNYCHIALEKGRSEKLVVITSVIDNLGKGASAQSIQNMNIIFGIKENTGLQLIPAFP